MDLTQGLLSGWNSTKEIEGSVITGDDSEIGGYGQKRAATQA